jgi:hypothetical protein
MGYISKGVPSTLYLAFFFIQNKETTENLLIQALAYIIGKIAAANILLY